MKKTYFSAIELVEKPFLTWNSIGTYTALEFAASPYADDPLVIPEDMIPDNAFGVCTQKIVAGELVDRTSGEMAVFEAEYEVYIGVKSERARIFDINNESFDYDGKQFPMDEVSRLFYGCIEITATNHKVRAMDNTAYALDDSDRAAFVAAFKAKLLSISKHTI